MNELDDAIREHLELKRRLGASEDELKVKEDEAFGRGKTAPAAPAPEAPVVSDVVTPGAAEPELPEPEPEPEPESEVEPAPEPSVPENGVLEKTPEFLEQSPDQDRLWFEQKPPKDFDFDD